MTDANFNATSQAKLAVRNFLHVGCGNAPPSRLPAVFRSPEWREIRLDIDPGVKPHIVASITDMNSVPDGCMDALWSSHNLEHLETHQVPQALAEFRRVLKDDGFAMINLPDLRAIARQILADNLGEALYVSPIGPIRPIDMLFGHQGSLERGHHYMAHRTGFTSTTLGQYLLEADFAEARVHEGRRWDLWAIATMPNTPAEIFDQLAGVAR